jgi:hypothetical protein
MQDLSWTEAVQSIARSKVKAYLTKLSYLISIHFLSNYTHFRVKGFFRER